tara:strand:+ start:571 stop:690 length:120 start_codon:yes stop_codon:yes gene_type:complete
MKVQIMDIFYTMLKTKAKKKLKTPEAYLQELITKDYQEK